MDEPVKFDAGKPAFELISPHAMFGLAKVLAFGAHKYGARNWENGLKNSRIFAAAMRHLWAWWLGEDLDEETGLSHLHHAAACIMMLQHNVEIRHKGVDDRPVL